MKPGEPDDPVTGVVRIAPPGEPARREQPPASIEEALEELLHARGAPDLVFQPIADLRRGVTVGYEVLSRFQGPPAQSPDRWFAAAERMGRSSELEALVIERALSRRDELPDECFLSINVAPAALLDARVQALFARRPLTRMVFELTEHSAVTDYDMLRRAIQEVRRLGGFVAVDDAGAGYASLQHILVLRPDFVKLDRSLLAGLHLDEAKAALVEMFGGFTSRIDAWLLAEGIEERAELTRLIALGVPLGQGYLLGRPAPGMAALPGALAREIRDQQPPAARASRVRPLAEHSASAAADAGEATLLATFAKQSAGSALVLLDARSRPAGLVLRTEAGALRRPVLCVLESTPVEEALRRALTRPAAERFDPLVCCDERGQYRGLLRLERLMEAALDAR